MRCWNWCRCSGGPSPAAERSARARWRWRRGSPPRTTLLQTSDLFGHGHSEAVAADVSSNGLEVGGCDRLAVTVRVAASQVVGLDPLPHLLQGAIQAAVANVVNPDGEMGAVRPVGTGKAQGFEIVDQPFNLGVVLEGELPFHAPSSIRISTMVGRSPARSNSCRAAALCVDALSIRLLEPRARAACLAASRSRRPIPPLLASGST